MDRGSEIMQDNYIDTLITMALRENQATEVFIYKEPMETASTTAGNITSKIYVEIERMRVNSIVETHSRKTTILYGTKFLSIIGYFSERLDIFDKSKVVHESKIDSYESEHTGVIIVRGSGSAGEYTGVIRYQFLSEEEE